jgi:hypothetical protein
MYQEVDIKDSRATFILIFCFTLLLEPGKKNLGQSSKQKQNVSFF